MDAITMTIDSQLGTLRLVERDRALAGIYLATQDVPWLVDVPRRTTRLLERAAGQLAEYFAGVRHAFDLPLSPRGTEFQRTVWRALAAIPYGETRSYGELARAIGRPAASRAVGSANANNPISIVVPCHRVIATSGSLTGYAGGVAAKRWLLDHELCSRGALATVPGCIGT